MDITDRINKTVSEVHRLVKVCLPKSTVKITYLTIFSQSEEDYLELNKMLSELGNKQEANHGVKFKLKNPFQIESETINLLRVRKPDVHRKEFGCADIKVVGSSYSELRELALKIGWDIIQRKTFEMIELSTFDINAYAYIMKYHI